MLDANLLEQIKPHFQQIQKATVFVVQEEEHEKKTELLGILEELAHISPYLSIRQEALAIPFALGFSIEVDGRDTGIRFAGIPGGHEFTSLILAILNSNDIGKKPDDRTIERIQSISESIDLQTFISLSCQNCPDVVQALNIVAIHNQSVTHTMIDGAIYPEKAEEYKIQAVPNVFANEESLHVGKSDLGELIQKLTESFQTEKKKTKTNIEPYDVLVVGGGPAGSSAAIYSARKGLRTALVTDKIGGQVRETKGIENLISTPFTEGPQLAANLEKHVLEYPIEVIEHDRIIRVEKNASYKIMHLQSGEKLLAKSVIVATGAKWRELQIPGEKEYLGRGVAFCPHCDGPFYKGKKVAVVGGGNSGVESAIDLAGIATEVTLFEYNDTLKADQVLIDRLHSLPNTNVITNAVTKEVLGDGEKVTALQYADRDQEENQSLSLDGIFVQIGLAPNSDFVKSIVETTPIGEIVIDTHGRTSEEGIFAAGDVSTVPYKQIVVAMGEGAKASLSAFDYLIRRGVA